MQREEAEKIDEKIKKDEKQKENSINFGSIE